MGYTFSEGDICTLTSSTNQYTLPVIGQSGKWILLSPKDIGSVLTSVYIFEIYTPYLPSSQEPYYEVGSMFSVTNPTTGTRAYSTLSGSVSGTVFLISRTYNAHAYKGEATCPNDKFWQRWDRDDGRINLITKEGKVTKGTGVQFSNTYVQGTLTNGLNSFEPLNQEILPHEMGALQATVLTSKVEEEGTVMLVIGTKQTASVYIGEVQVTNSDSTSYFIKSTGVIAQVNILRGDYGTIHPESVVLYNGDVRWFDCYNGKFVQYSVNGLDEISEGQNQTYKLLRVSTLLARKFLATPTATIEGYGSRPFIFGGVDPVHGEIYWTFPKLDTVVPKGQLSDYVSSLPSYMDSADYPYDILDYKAKTLVYKVTAARWRGEFSWTPEEFTTLDSDTYSFKAGRLYKHNISGTYNRFYGTAYRSKVMTVFNKANTVKEAQSLAIEGSLPEWVHFRSEQPDVQSTDLIATDFTPKEGVYYAALYRDRLSPNITGSTDQKQLSGDPMRTKALLTLIQFGSEDQIKYVRLVSLGYNESTGHY
jgi:hypothetical protein